MKRSTKILIILGIVLFVLPVGAMVFYNLSTSVDSTVYAEAMRNEGRDPESQDLFLITHTPGTFHKVSISSQEYAYISLYIIESEKYAVKVDVKNNENITYSIDASGVLNIESKTNGRFTMTSLYVFAPNIKDIQLSNIQVGNLETNLDSLNITGHNLNNFFRLGDNGKLTSLNLSLKRSNISLETNSGNGAMGRLQNLKRLYLKLDSSNVALDTKNYDYIMADLSASGLSGIRERNGGEKSTIENLQLLTQGASSVTLDNQFLIHKITGELSDSTSSTLPMYLLRDLIKK